MTTDLSGNGVVGHMGTRACIEMSSLSGLVSSKFMKGLVSVDVDMVGGCKKVGYIPPGF
jgi:hypothetical protein